MYKIQVLKWSHNFIINNYYYDLWRTSAANTSQISQNPYYVTLLTISPHSTIIERVKSVTLLIITYLRRLWLGIDVCLLSWKIQNNEHFFVSQQDFKFHPWELVDMNFKSSTSPTHIKHPDYFLLYPSPWSVKTLHLL